MVCGHGTRYRNLSCVVSDGSLGDGGSLVEEELCEGLDPAVSREEPVRLKEPCYLPCPGETVSTATREVTSP